MSIGRENDQSSIIPTLSDRSGFRAVFLFRMASGLVQLTNGSNATLELLGATMADGMIAVTIILAMSFGVVVPKVVIDRLGDGATQSRH